MKGNFPLLPLHLFYLCIQHFIISSLHHFITLSLYHFITPTMSPSIEDLENAVEKIQARNQRVELNKARETSRTRKILIACLTYIVIVLFFFAAKLTRPFLNALVPTIAFILSTLWFDLFKKIWLKHRK